MSPERRGAAVREALQRARREAESLLAIARVVGGTNSLQEALRLICRELAHLTGADTVAAYVLDPLGVDLRPAAAYRVPKDALPVLSSLSIPLAAQGFRDELVERGRPLWSDDVAGDPRFGFETFRRFAHQSSLMLPLVLEDAPRAAGAPPVASRVSGAFYLVWWSERRRFDEAELATLHAVGVQVGTLLRNARLVEALGSRATRLETLIRVNRVITSSPDPEAIFPVLAEAAVSLFPGAACRVWIVEGDRARLRAEHGISAASAGQHGELRLGQGLIGQVCASGMPVVLDDIHQYGDLQNAAWVRAQGFASIAALPLTVSHSTVGAFVVLTRETHRFDGEEVALLQTLAEQTAVVLEKSRLYAEARTQKMLLEHIFASTSDGLLFLDQTGRVATLNRRGEELLGVSALRVVGEPAEHLMDAIGARLAWGDAEGQRLRDIIDDPSAEAAGDLEILGPPLRTLRWQASPTLDGLGTRVGITLTLRDVTREREIDRLKSEFVSTVSHELRTPLTSIKGALHLLRADAPTLDAGQRELLDISLTNADRLVRLVDDILDVSRIEAGRLRLSLACGHVREFVGPAVDGLRMFAKARDVRVATALPDDLPQVRVDLDRMVQVMTNLLSNAIKFSPAGGEVRVTAAPAPSGVEIQVIDHGRGIAAGDLPRLFQKFEQLDGRDAPDAEGTGLGLAICRSLVNDHGGALRAESVLGQGSTFTVALPAVTVEAEGPVR